MISFVWEKFVHNMARTVQYFQAEVVIHVSNQLRQIGVTDCCTYQSVSVSLFTSTFMVNTCIIICTS